MPAGGDARDTAQLVTSVQARERVPIHPDLLRAPALGEDRVK